MPRYGRPVKDFDAETVGPVGEIRTVVSTLPVSDNDVAASGSGFSGVKGVSSTGDTGSSFGSRCSTVISYLAGVFPLCLPANRNLGEGNVMLFARD